MLKLRKTLYVDRGRKCEKVSSEVVEYEDVYACYRDAHLTVFHLPSSFELSIETVGKSPRELAVFVGMGGEALC